MLKKRFYNRERIAALNYEIQKMTSILCKTNINPFLSSKISANHEKMEELTAKIQPPLSNYNKKYLYYPSNHNCQKISYLKLKMFGYLLAQFPSGRE